jgi:hypothetical protein
MSTATQAKPVGLAKIGETVKPSRNGSEAHDALISALTISGPKSDSLEALKSATVQSMVSAIREQIGRTERNGERTRVALAVGTYYLVASGGTDDKGKNLVPYTVLTEPLGLSKGTASHLHLAGQLYIQHGIDPYKVVDGKFLGTVTLAAVGKAMAKIRELAEKSPTNSNTRAIEKLIRDTYAAKQAAARTAPAVEGESEPESAETVPAVQSDEDAVADGIRTVSSGVEMLERLGDKLSKSDLAKVEEIWTRLGALVYGEEVKAS